MTTPVPNDKTASMTPSTRSLRSGTINVDQRKRQSETKKAIKSSGIKQPSLKKQLSAQKAANSSSNHPITKAVSKINIEMKKKGRLFPQRNEKSAIDNLNSQNIQSTEDAPEFIEPLVQLRNAINSLITQYNLNSNIVSHTSASGKTNTSSSSISWGNLLSEYNYQPHIDLNTSNFTIGRSSKCSYQLRDNSVSGIVCRLFQAASGAPTLESCTNSSSLTVNNIVLRKGTRCVLKNGDRIAIAAAVKPCSYIFLELNRKDSTTSSSIARVENTKKRRMDETVASSSDSLVKNESNKRRKLNLEGISTSGDFFVSNRYSNSNDQEMLEINREKMVQKSPEKLNEEKIKCKEAFQRMVINPSDINVSFDEFPYYLSTESKQLLISSCFPFLKRPQFLKYTSSVLSMNRCVLLKGPPGTEIYQEKLVQALCRELDVHLLSFSASETNSLERNQLNFPFPPTCTTILPFNSITSKEWESDTKIRNEVIDISEELIASADDELAVTKLETRQDDGALLLPTEFQDTISKLPRAALVSLNEEKEVIAPHKFRFGDRVQYVGLQSKQTLENLNPENKSSTNINSSSFPNPDIPPLFSRMGLSRPPDLVRRGPLVGSKGRVILVFLDKVGVRFDESINGGNNLGNRCEEDRGYFVNVNELRTESECSYDISAEIAALEALIETALDSDLPSQNRSTLGSTNLSTNSCKEMQPARPCVIYLPNIKKLACADYERYVNFKKQIDQLPIEAPLVVIGSSVSPMISLKEKKGKPATTGSLLLSKSGGCSSLFDLSFFDTLNNHIDERCKKGLKTSKVLSNLFPVKVKLHAPRGGKELAQWNRQIAADVETLRCKENILTLRKYLNQSNLICDSFPERQLKEKVFDADSIQKVISWALSRHLESTPIDKIKTQNDCLVLSKESLGHAIGMLFAVEAEASSIDRSLKDIVPENEFEKRLLQETVIPSIEVNVKFDDVGALDRAKRSLQELVMLPLQRPELFTRGQLTTPCKGILLFGPPGTGKTMLAKAVATEAGARFLAISMSNIASKWFGDGEKYVKSLFSLASKIAPTVIFIDEVDSILGRREKQGEHEAMRKIKNEFMSNWDGLRTKPYERVTVLAATNRPFDLDDAVLRRFPRRIMIDLPTSEQREKILLVILQEEELDEDFDLKKLAADEFTAGFSGSDLKNLCVAAAYQPILELLKKEQLLRTKSIVSNSRVRPHQHVNAQSEGKSPLRPLNLRDFQAAKKEVTASMSEDSFTMQEVRKWNDIYGDGGSRRTTTLSYYM